MREVEIVLKPFGHIETRLIKDRDWKAEGWNVPIGVMLGPQEISAAAALHNKLKEK